MHVEGLFDLDIATTQTVAVIPHLPSGVGRATIAIPPIPSFVAVEIYLQQMMLPAAPLSPGFSNVVVERILP